MVGTVALIIGVAAGLAFEKYASVGISNLISAVAGPMLTLGIALYVINYKNSVDERRHEAFVHELVQAVRNEVLKLALVAELEGPHGLENDDRKLQRGARDLVSLLRSYKTHAGDIAIGSYRFRMAVIKLNGTVERAKDVLDDVPEHKIGQLLPVIRRECPKLQVSMKSYFEDCGKAERDLSDEEMKRFQGLIYR